MILSKCNCIRNFTSWANEELYLWILKLFFEFVFVEGSFEESPWSNDLKLVILLYCACAFVRAFACVFKNYLQSVFFYFWVFQPSEFDQNCIRVNFWDMWPSKTDSLFWHFDRYLMSWNLLWVFEFSSVVLQWLYYVLNYNRIESILYLLNASHRNDLGSSARLASK